MQRERARRTVLAIWFQSSPAPKSGCNLEPALKIVSIQRVSILTRPEERVQRAVSGDHSRRRKFQSSPAPKSGCNANAAEAASASHGFNPHPPRRAGATNSPARLVSSRQVSILTRPEERVQRDGIKEADMLRLVSILTRPEERVQLRRACNVIERAQVSILTRPEERVQRLPLRADRSDARVSILTRPEERVQRSMPSPSPRYREFQSSPAPKSGCNVSP